MPVVTIGTPELSLGQGSPTDIIVGTKTSGPRGIESVLEFNQLFLNNRSWVDTYLVTQINGLDDADVRDNREVNPGQHGETPFASYYGGRTLVLQGKIQAHTIWKLRDMEQALRKAFADLSKEYPLIFRTNDANTDMLIYCKKSSPILMPDEQKTSSGFERSFQITLRASNPRFISYREYFATSLDAVPIAVNNIGNFEAQPKFRIYGPSNAVANGGTSLIVPNDANDQALILKALPGSTVALAAGRYIDIDIAKHTMSEYATATDAFVGNAFNRLDIASDWPELESGLNNLSVIKSVAGDATEVQIRYRNTYM